MGPAFVFVVDTCTAEEELGALKNELLLVVEQLPENALVGLVTFDSMVRVHDLGFSECSRVVLFHGEREISSEQVLIIMFNNATHTSMLRHCFYRTPITTCHLNNCKKKVKFGVLLVVFLLICSNKIQLHGTISSHIIPNHNVCTWNGAC